MNGINNSSVDFINQQVYVDHQLIDVTRPNNNHLVISIRNLATKIYKKLEIANNLIKKNPTFTKVVLGTFIVGLPLIWARYYNASLPTDSAVQPLLKDQCFNSSLPLCFHPQDSSVMEFLNAQNEFNLGMKYIMEGAQQNYESAFKHFQIAVDQGYPEAQRNLGEMHALGNGVEKNPKVAEEYYLLAAKQGDSVAQYHLGEIYEKDDFKKSLNYYTLAANQGHLKAQYWLAKNFIKLDLQYPHYPHSMSFKKAIKYCKLAVKQNHVGVKELLDQLYISNSHWSQEAFNQCKLIADKGNHEAQEMLQYLYTMGRGVERNPQKAYEYFKLANENNANIKILIQDLEDSRPETFRYWKMLADDYHIAKAQYHVFMRYKFARGVEQNLLESQKYFWLYVYNPTARWEYSEYPLSKRRGISKKKGSI